MDCYLTLDHPGGYGGGSGGSGFTDPTVEFDPSSPSGVKGDDGIVEREHYHINNGGVTDNGGVTAVQDGPFYR